jgi:2-oxoglutarate dehydrogenase E2 component (dihydrolipoamide succinyltransferase)
MAAHELVMPKMGESIIEATILNWVKKEGDEVEVDETILEIATDKVDSEVPSPVKGTISKILFEEDDVVPIGETIAIIETEAEEGGGAAPSGGEETVETEESPEEEPSSKPEPQPAASGSSSTSSKSSEEVEKKARPSNTSRFYSPLVRNIAAKEGLSMGELESIEGSGREGRVTKKDILNYLDQREAAPSKKKAEQEPTEAPISKKAPTVSEAPEVSIGGEDEVVEMDRMRKMIAEHMVRSKQTSPHVTSFVEVDVTNIVTWRNEHKAEFQKKFGEKITYTPLFIEAITKALRDFPGVNASVDGDKIIQKHHINIGMAAALPSGNLIVPVIKDADHLSLVGLTKKVNDLARRARSNDLTADEIQGGTFTLTNVGTFGNVMGTPIIFQPQVAIMAAGAIRKKPAVVETEYGDVIAVRHMMYLSLSYDHRVVDGMLGGSFLRKVGDYLEEFDPGRSI